VDSDCSTPADPSLCYPVAAAAAPTNKTRAASCKTRAASRKPRSASRKAHDGGVYVEVGDRVQVFWEGEGEWYGGEVINVDRKDGSYRVHYFLDNENVWHGPEWDVRTLVE